MSDRLPNASRDRSKVAVWNLSIVLLAEAGALALAVLRPDWLQLSLGVAMAITGTLLAIGLLALWQERNG